MILTITLYQDADGNDRFKVMAGDPLTDLTDQYELVATATPDGRVGFAVFKRANV